MVYFAGRGSAGAQPPPTSEGDQEHFAAVIGDEHPSPLLPDAVVMQI